PVVAVEVLARECTLAFHVVQPEAIARVVGIDDRDGVHRFGWHASAQSVESFEPERHSLPQKFGVIDGAPQPRVIVVTSCQLAYVSNEWIVRPGPSVGLEV